MNVTTIQKTVEQKKILPSLMGRVCFIVFLFTESFRCSRKEGQDMVGYVLKMIEASVLMVWIGCSLVFAGGQPDLMGSWQYNGPESSIELLFQSGNILVFDGEAIAYSLVKGAIRIEEEGEIVDYPYHLKDQMLVITFPDGCQLPFVRVGKGILSSPQTALHDGANASDQGNVPGSKLMQQISGVWWGYAHSTE